MSVIAFDTETHLVTPGNKAPPLVCLSMFDGEVPSLHDRKDAYLVAKTFLEDKALTLVGHNVAFDMGVLAANYLDLQPAIWQAYEDDRVRDTMIRGQLQAIATDRFRFDPYLRSKPTFSLEEMAKQYLGVQLKKDTWRLRYAQLDDIPIAQWPQDAIDYAVKDATTTYHLWALRDDGDNPKDEWLQVKVAWALHLISCWGMITDQEAVRKLERQLREELKDYDELLIGAKLIDEKTKSRDMAVIKQAVQEAYARQGLDPPRTSKGNIRTNEDTLRLANDPNLTYLADSLYTRKLLTSFVPQLKPLIHPWFHVLVVSGRTSCSGPNVQQLPKKGNVRECFIPRLGYVYVDSDFSIAELCSLAEACYELLGWSTLGDTIREGKDPHLVMGASILGIDYEIILARYKAGDQQAKDARQLAKSANFGYPGGLGAKTFVTYARNTWGVEITVAEATALKHRWLNRYPEMRDYFRLIGDMGNNFRLVQLKSGRVRGGVGFCDGCNGIFQGLTADGAKHSTYNVVRECYTPGTVLYGSRVVNFIHDELLLECPREIADECGKRLTQVMVETMGRWVTRVPIKADYRIMERWTK